MPEEAYEIRICDSCGLRYPLVEGHAFGIRCPACLGGTRIVLRRDLVTESGPSLPREFSPVTRTVAVLLDNVRSAWNTGSILRSADGFGFSQAYLCGITPTPELEAVRKTSLGAEDSVPWSYHRDAVRLVKGLKREGFRIHALEEHERAVDIRKTRPVAFSHSVLVVGNEVTGVDPGLLELCDTVISIPMRGQKKSFNVAIAFGIAAFALRQE